MILSFFEIRNPPWWNRRTRLERFLCALTAVTMATCVAMCITLAMVQLRPLGILSIKIDKKRNSDQKGFFESIFD